MSQAVNTCNECSLMLPRLVRRFMQTSGFQQSLTIPESRTQWNTLCLTALPLIVCAFAVFTCCRKCHSTERSTTDTADKKKRRQKKYGKQTLKQSFAKTPDEYPGGSPIMPPNTIGIMQTAHQSNITSVQSEEKVKATIFNESTKFEPDMVRRLTQRAWDWTKNGQTTIQKGGIDDNKESKCPLPE
ncbi:hypothetical protein M513_06886 [Trichuris suis]|uniref:Uncharacterized protein n=1 Tax=Trichuris suis TaxID=68888 RepID=A0A085M4M7_9BILA|nr:hypothetical protein M513_06886 [Trichuris suis]